ncbi:hypothetical protein IV203_013928 [Nitzschia inconspicua]|uniref:HIG1 domain-containing protein n=1 Tax=Nitzschia inconspicua TaxID=303405 RepID=A0A9K3Q8E6_9STRA|nr:hypothetical protein IV203_013928 [Nitzschia inconspicua]
MASLTPDHRSDEVTGAAMKEGLMSGGVVLVPCLAGLYVAMQNPNFRKFTNWQSRTALVIMPALFAFGFTSENKLIHRMEEVASETEHNMKTVAWAEKQKSMSQEDIKLHQLYRQAILDSGVRLVDTPELNTYQKAANYVQSNPFKVIAAIGVPSVAAIFYGQGTHGTGKESFQMQLLHTRVFGQFTVICTLLGVMGMKEMMDRQGRFVTDDEIESRVAEMEATRTAMMTRTEYQDALKHGDHGSSGVRAPHAERIKI